MSGSSEPIEGLCAAKVRGSDPTRYCKNKPHPGSPAGRCRLHGGTKKRGAESPNFVHGQRSSLYADVLGGALKRGYEAIQSDEELLSCREQIKLWSGRERQLVEQIAGGGLVDWQASRDTMADIDAVGRMPAGTDEERQRQLEAFARALDEHRQAVHQLVADEKAWRELEHVGRMLARFRREERQLVEAKHAVMTVDKVLYMSRLLTAVAMKYIVDPVVRSRFCEDVKLLEAGHAVEIDAELIEGVWVGRRPV